uniref:Uncharacterized protein n=1 Tax=Mucochytrium quahogii TaxID=96639 RepID=A0A7S2WS07_9STRA|mmetsp:Transcript_4747/g.8516  ORF Transcript_4747/g.8516 Transcript_4747/m.8516 type:complete len:558 (-) Transcript_4747:1459-3132(-)
MKVSKVKDEIEQALGSGVSKLSFGDVGLTDELVAFLIEKLSKSPHASKVKSLVLQTNTIGDDGARCISKFLVDGKCKVTSLYINDNKITDAGCEHLGQALAQNKSLKRLYLTRNSIGDEGVLKLVNGLEKNELLCTLTLGGMAIGDMGVNSICELLLQPGCALTEIRLDGNKNITPEGMSQLASALKIRGGQVQLTVLGDKSSSGFHNTVKQAMSKDSEQAKKYMEAKKALGKIVVEEARAEAVRMQFALLQACKTSPKTLNDPAGEIFVAMQTLAHRESQRLEQLMATCTEKYQHLSIRWEKMLEIFKNEVQPCTQPPRQNIFPEICPDGCGDPEKQADYLEVLYGVASFAAPEFEQEMSTLIQRFNAASTPSDLGLDPERFPLRISSANMKGGKKAMFSGVSIKTRKRLQEKMSHDYVSQVPPIASHVVDLVRCQVVLDDPYALSIFFLLLDQTFTIQRVKNFFIEDATQKRAYKYVLLNLLYDNKMVCEVQLALQDLTLIKEELHMFYQIERANQPKHVIKKFLFKPHTEKVPTVQKKLSAAQNTDRTINGVTK